MKAVLLCLCGVILLVGCTKHGDGPAQSIDSTFTATTPADTLRTPSIQQNGLIIDSSAINTEHLQHQLSRFTPKQVLALYQAFRPLRTPQTSASVDDSFLNYHHITKDELRAVLLEGDRLGWGANP